MGGITTADEAEQIVAGVGGGTSIARGREIHEFVRDNRLTSCLELGFAHGVSSVWIASALEGLGTGSLTCVDNLSAKDRDPSAQALVDKAGLTDRVAFHYEQTSYTFFLRRIMRQQLRGDRIEPLYDFVFLDGAHVWEPDGLAFALVDKLLKPGGWLLLDDLEWHPKPEHYPGMPQEQLELAAVQEVWDLMVMTNPTYDELRTDGLWGWARKSTSPAPEVRTVVKRDLVGAVRQVGKMGRSKLKR